MSISVNYTQPIQVNGFTCKNCTDVDYATKHIDPAHPQAGPYGVNAATDPSLKNAQAFLLGGRLGEMHIPSASLGAGRSAAPGQSLNIIA